MQLFPIILVCCCALCLSCVHFAGAWDKAYARLGYDLWRADDEAYERQVSDSDPYLSESQVDSSGQPIWTTKWQFSTGLNTFLSFMPMPLVTSLHNPNLTQKLVLGKLAMDCAARCAAATFASTELFGLTKPRHYMLIGQLTFRIICFLVLLAHLFHHVSLPTNTFLLLWLMQYFVGSSTASQIDVTIVRFAPVALRKVISRRNTLTNFSSIALALAVDVAILFVP